VEEKLSNESFNFQVGLRLKSIRTESFSSKFDWSRMVLIWLAVIFLNLEIINQRPASQDKPRDARISEGWTPLTNCIQSFATQPRAAVTTKVGFTWVVTPT
jgi:hypothetical protein